MWQTNSKGYGLSYRNNSANIHKMAAARRAQARAKQQGDGRAPDTRKTTPALPPTEKAVSALCSFVEAYSHSEEGSQHASCEREILNRPGNVNSLSGDINRSASSSNSDSLIPEVNFCTFQSELSGLKEVVSELQARDSEETKTADDDRTKSTKRGKRKRLAVTDDDNEEQDSKETQPPRKRSCSTKIQHVKPKRTRLPANGEVTSNIFTVTSPNQSQKRRSLTREFDAIASGATVSECSVRTHYKDFRYLGDGENSQDSDYKG
jgi:hypothetical protein